MGLVELDTAIYHAFNDICGWNPTLDRAVVHLEVLKGSLFMGIFGYLWFKQDADQLRRRETLLAIVLATAVALALNRTVSMLVPFRVRPMFSIGANAPTFDWHADLEHWSSFPSDNATYLFAIATGLWLVSRSWGLLFGIFAAAASLARVYLGIHFPSDVLVGALIGVVAGLVVNREWLQTKVSVHLLGFEKQKPAYFYGLLFLVLAELSGGFPNTRRIGVAVVHLFTGYEHDHPHQLVPRQAPPRASSAARS